MPKRGLGDDLGTRSDRHGAGGVGLGVAQVVRAVREARIEVAPVESKPAASASSAVSSRARSSPPAGLCVM